MFKAYDFDEFWATKLKFDVFEVVSKTTNYY